VYIKVVRSFEASGISNPVGQRDIAQDLNSLHWRCRNLEFCKWSVLSFAALCTLVTWRGGGGGWLHLNTWVRPLYYPQLVGFRWSGCLGLLKMSPVSEQKGRLCFGSKSEMLRLEMCKTPCRVEAVTFQKIYSTSSRSVLTKRSASRGSPNEVLFLKDTTVL
jgi:hypothetical protein